MIKRKMIVFAALATAASLAFSGCATTTPGEDSGGDTLYFTGWGGQYQEAIAEAIIVPFEKEFNVTVVQDSPTDYVKIQSMVESGKVTWDVTDNDPFFVNPNCGTFFEKIDPSVDVSGVPKPIQAPCAVPIIQFAQNMMYNTDTYPDPATAPKGWDDFFDTDKFPGTRAIGNYVTYGAMEAALMADGVARDALYPIDYDRAFAKLDTIKDSLVFWDTGAQQEQMLASGEPDMMIVWSGRAATQMRNGAPYAPVFDGAVIAYNTLAVTKGTPNSELAMKFIDFALKVEQQSKLAELISYSPGNSNATPVLDEIGQQFNVIDPAISSISVYQDMTWWGNNLDEGVDQWTSWAVG